MTTCRICGQPGSGIDFDKWVRPTFTNWDLLHPGNIICDSCLFWFDQRSTELQVRMGKDKPQRMQNYSHFIVAGEWIPLSKSDKSRMAEILLNDPFPELAAIVDSGQKHIAFRATRNPPGSSAGHVQFEEQSVFVVPNELKYLLNIIENLYEVFSKSEIESGDYASYRVLKFGLKHWQGLEGALRPQRGRPLFSLALFLAQKRSKDEPTGIEEPGSDTAGSDLAGNTGRLQEPLSDDDLDTVRERDPERGVHQQPGKIRQLDVFEDERGPG